MIASIRDQTGIDASLKEEKIKSYLLYAKNCYAFGEIRDWSQFTKNSQPDVNEVYGGTSNIVERIKLGPTGSIVQRIKLEPVDY